jgi:hypothetical protein
MNKFSIKKFVALKIATKRLNRRTRKKEIVAYK